VLDIVVRTYPNLDLLHRFSWKFPVLNCTKIRPCWFMRTDRRAGRTWSSCSRVTRTRLKEFYLTPYHRRIVWSFIEQFYADFLSGTRVIKRRVILLIIVRFEGSVTTEVIMAICTVLLLCLGCETVRSSRIRTSKKVRRISDSFTTRYKVLTR
jgi:hypothetical protein